MVRNLTAFDGVLVYAACRANVSSRSTLQGSCRAANDTEEAMGIHNRLAKLVIDPAFRQPWMMRAIFAIDDVIGLDVIRRLAPFKMLPVTRELFSRCFAHFVEGERISLRCATALSELAPDEKSRAYLRVQAREEQGHLAHFRDKLDAFGIEADLSRYVAPNFARFGTVIDRAIARGDYVGALIGNNVVVEGMAISLLTLGCTSMRENSDEIGAFMDFVLRDEQHHVRFGERALARFAAADLIDYAAANEMAQEMWEAAALAVDEIPEVLAALDLDAATLKPEMRAFFNARLAPAHIAIAG